MFFFLSQLIGTRTAIFAQHAGGDNGIKKQNAWRDTTLLKNYLIRAEEYLDGLPDSSIYLCETVLGIISGSTGLTGKGGITWQRIKATALINLGRAYEGYGDIPKGIMYYEQSLRIHESINDMRGKAFSLNNLAEVYEMEGDVENAFNYYNQSLKLLQAVNDKQGESDALNNLAHVYENKNMFDSAMVFFNRSKLIRETERDTIGIAMSINNLGTLYFMMGNFKEAERCFKESVPLRKQVKDNSGLAASLTNLAYIYKKTGKNKEALAAAGEAMRLSRMLKQPGKIRSAAKIMYSIYKKTGNNKLALENYELYILMLDSINKESNKKASIKSQLKYEYAKKSAADSVKNAEAQKVKQAQIEAQNAQIKQEKVQRYALFGGLLLVMGGLVFAINRFKVTQRQKKIIEKQKVIVDEAFDALAEKNKEVLDSIFYARRIQRCLITSERYIEKSLKRLIRNA